MLKIAQDDVEESTKTANEAKAASEQVMEEGRDAGGSTGQPQRSALQQTPMLTADSSVDRPTPCSKKM